MRPRPIFQKAGNVLDLSRNYYLLKDETLSSFPVQVIPLPGPLDIPSLHPTSAECAPPHSTTAASPRSTTSCHSKSSATASVSPGQPTSAAVDIPVPFPMPREMTGQMKNTKAAKGKAKALNPITRNQKEKAGIIFKEIVRQIYAGPENRSTCMEKSDVSEVNNKKQRGWPKGRSRNPRKRKLQEQPIGCEQKETKKRGRPPGISKKIEKREVEKLGSDYEKEKKTKGGWQKGMPRNPEKRKLWEQARQSSTNRDKIGGAEETIKNHHEAEDSAQTRKNIRKDDDFLQATKKMQQQKPILMEPEEARPKTGTDKAAIIAGLTDVMLQMTKITQDVLRLMAMASGGCENN